ncbi:MAG: hypothetical protein KIT84_41480 [Labilithrix sp.]|nr:hypothetical protein [Labilithrix sp.]MCW5817544.1 hypothetical protein [Labilithrix sp.]
MSTSREVPQTRPGSTRALVALLAFVLGFATVPHRVCEREAARWLEGDPKSTDALAAGVARWTNEELDATSFATGSSRFDGEWLFGTYVMAGIGFGQLARAREDTRAENVARLEHCLDVLETERLRAFDRAAWNEDAIESLDRDENGHVAYLGYVAVPYALHRVLAPESRFAAREEAIVGALERRILASPIGFVTTYPGEVYPVDNATIAAALALHSRAVGRARSPAQDKLAASIRGAVDPESGLLFQAVEEGTAKPRDAARASGSALAATLLAYAEPDLSASLFRALARGQFRTVLGFGAVMEHPPSKHGKTDIDSGPVVLGFGVSATGFSLGASRAHGDREVFTALYATAHLFGTPFDENGARTYATGGPLGDAIMFAMLTTPRLGGGS